MPLTRRACLSAALGATASLALGGPALAKQSPAFARWVAHGLELDLLERTLALPGGSMLAELKGEAYQLYKTYTKVGILESPSLKGLKIGLKEIF